MNIFAKIITTSDENIKNAIIERLFLIPKEKINHLEIYTKLEEEANIVLIYSKNDIENSIHYGKENYEIVKILNIWTSLPLDDLDITFWDVIIPNTFINKENDVVFLEYLVEKNYDLKNFWLLLNGICLSLENEIINEEALDEIIQNYSAEVFDTESFNITKTLEKNDLLDKSCIIKIVWKDEDFIKNWIQILEIML